MRESAVVRANSAHLDVGIVTDSGLIDRFTGEDVKPFLVEYLVIDCLVVSSPEACVYMFTTLSKSFKRLKTLTIGGVLVSDPALKQEYASIIAKELLAVNIDLRTVSALNLNGCFLRACFHLLLLEQPRAFSKDVLVSAFCPCKNTGEKHACTFSNDVHQ